MSGALSRREFQAALLGGAVGLTGCAAPRAVRRVIAVDCHAHVFRRDLPMPDQRRAPAGYDATPEQYLSMLDENGMSHGVLVQPSFLGTDNSYLVAALRKYPERLRGIAVVEPTATSVQLQLLQDAGVVGIRLNLIGLPAPNLTSAVRPVTPPHQAIQAERRSKQGQGLCGDGVSASVRAISIGARYLDPNLARRPQ